MPAFPGSLPVGGAWRAARVPPGRIRYPSQAGRFKLWWGCAGPARARSELEEDDGETAGSVPRLGSALRLGADRLLCDVRPALDPATQAALPARLAGDCRLLGRLDGLA